MFLLVKRRPKGGENFGRQILGGKSTKSTKRQIFGVEKKNYTGVLILKKKPLSKKDFGEILRNFVNINKELPRF